MTDAHVMDRWRHEDPCAGVDDLARGMAPGLMLNLLARDLERAIAFQCDILGAEAIYRDGAFAIMGFGGTRWMLHADATYGTHPMLTGLGPSTARGAGCELRLHGCDPDAAVARAERPGSDAVVIAEARDRPHGLREAFLQGPDGYVWVPSVLRADVAG